MKIIDKDMPLPCSVTITSKIDFYNMLFKVIEIYSDVEGNYKEKIASISLYLKNYIPINTKVFIEITLDENEIIDANMNIKAGSKKYKSILGRGQKDSTCINTIWEVIDKIQNGNFAKDIKSNSINNIRRLLNQFPIEEMVPMDVRWSEIDYKTKNIYDEIFKN